MYDVYLDRMLLPISPDKISYSIKNQNEVVNLINNGELNILKSEGLKEISFKIVLPAYNYPYINKMFGFNKPTFYLDKLQRLKSNRKPFQFIVTRRYPNNKSYFNTNIKVSLEEYTYSDDVGEFMDIVVDVKLKEYKEARTNVLKMLDDNISGYLTMPREVTKVIDKIYTTGAGEKLWNVCRTQLGGVEKMANVMKWNGISKLADYVPTQVLKLTNRGII